MSGANASPIGRSLQEMRGANASAIARSLKTRSASATARSLKKFRSHLAITRRALLVVLIAAAAATSTRAQVSYDRILRSGQEPQNWLTHSGIYNSQRYSTLSQVTPENVKNLELQWIF